MSYLKQIVGAAKANTPPKNKILAISGSPRKNGNTDLLLNEVTTGAHKENIECETVNLSTIEISGCLGCEKCRKDKICTEIFDGMSTLYPSIMESKALILASPVHNYNITSWMKAFIDRLYCFYEFDNSSRPRSWYSRLAQQNRKAFVIAVCEQENIEDMGVALDAMKLPIQALGYEVAVEISAFRAFEKGAIKKQNNIMKQVYDATIELAKSL